ncbi:MAG: undecaprenyl-phosphate glucose phosphotransferase [Flavobacteriaceae bacterium]
MDKITIGYSKYLKLINISVHLVILNLTFWYFDKSIGTNLSHILFINMSWLIIAYLSNFYSTYRYIDLTKLIARLILQFILFTLSYFSFYALSRVNFNIFIQAKIFITLFPSLLTVRLFFFFSLRAYRKQGGNYRRVIIIGNSVKEKELQDFFINRTEFGYKFFGFFSKEKTKNKYYLGNINNAFDFVTQNGIDEIYCSLGVLTKEQIKKFIKFSEDNYKTLKFIPKEENLLTSELNVEYYDYIPIVNLRKNPLSKLLESTVKRLFDIFFSLFVIVLILSWLTPILFILIKIESKGPLFFKQVREGLNGKRFNCFKFRSMKRNKLENVVQTSRNDERITKMGSFIRKTSIDELPQFINVFLGSMSVVGPRPHMISQGDKFKKIVDKYAVRHFVKPGVTGLAQVKGFRGEITKTSDIQNRVKYDIFYIENWSLLLDIKIIVLTVLNSFKGEENAF